MPRDDIDWRAIQNAQAQVMSGVAIRVHYLENAIDRLGELLSEMTGKPWEPVSNKWPEWPDENDPRFRKERTGGDL
jgi:hypothetical protein